MQLLMCCRPGALSLNAAIFASVLLASRLPSVLQVFGLVALAVLLFTFLPMVRFEIKARHS